MKQIEKKVGKEARILLKKYESLLSLAIAWV